MASNSYKKPDFYSQKAFAEGYPARSVFKLEEMDNRFSLLKKGFKVLDLGAAPGSWTMFALKKVGSGGSVFAVDLKDLSKNLNAPNLTFIKGDLFADNIQEAVTKAAPFDLVISDAAPATTGNRIVDTAQSEGLAELALFYAEKMLKPGGCFVAKIFQGGGQQKLLADMRKIFEESKGFKPKACRNESFETYLVGLRKKEQ
ncbi:MAG: RlmE family RNA methyltransferase [Spirochaetaceae bacterium]|nr:RlmE family RNA methyltransferase [Spirochaetaceae bacterium]